MLVLKMLFLLLLLEVVKVFNGGDIVKGAIVGLNDIADYDLAVVVFWIAAVVVVVAVAVVTTVIVLDNGVVAAVVVDDNNAGVAVAVIVRDDAGVSEDDICF